MATNTRTDSPKPPSPGGPRGGDNPKPKLSAGQQALLRTNLAALQDQYNHQFGGASYSGAEAQATRDYADAQLAAGAITQEQHDSFFASSHAMAQNFRKEQAFFGRMQDIQRKLGETVSGFVPPGWDSTAQGILAGTVPLPSAQFQQNYPGLTQWLAANPGAGDNYVAGSAHHPTAGAAPSTGDLYQPFTGVSGEQQGVPGYSLTQYPDAASAMTAAHTALASHYASAATAGDFNTAATMQSALAVHQSLLPQDTGFAVPDTFSEQHLTQEAQFR